MASNTDDTSLERRLAAVERAVDGRTGEAPDATAADDEPRAERLVELERRIDELDAALQAVRGFLGGVEAVNESVESRADAAIAAVDRLERRLDGADIKDGQRPSGETRDGDDDPAPASNRGTGVQRATEATGGTTESTAPDDSRPLRDRLPDPW